MLRRLPSRPRSRNRAVYWLVVHILEEMFSGSDFGCVALLSRSIVSHQRRRRKIDTEVLGYMYIICMGLLFFKSAMIQLAQEPKSDVS